jgi:hypothetical protein
VANPFVWLELRAREPQRSRSFYGRLFGWNVHELGSPPVYTIFDVGGATGGGMLACPGSRDYWLALVEVADVAEAAARAERLGAAIVERSEGPAGLRTVIIDPGGARIALWQSKRGD